MYKIALKMLIEDRAKYLGLILSLSFSALIITQQSGIFLGLMRRTFGPITDANQADIWVMDPNVRFIDDLSPMRGNELFRVRSVEGVAWAVPFYKGQIRARVGDGTMQTCTLYGIDDASLIGGPPRMVQGSLEDLRRPDAIIVDRIGGAEDKLARSQGADLPKVPLRVGDVVELNDNRAYVAGICEVTRSFQSNPVLYTTYSRALSYAPYERKMLSYILVKAVPTMAPQELCKNITARTGLAAYTADEFAWRTVSYYLNNTGIPINFGLAVLLGILVGTALAGQIFYNFTSDTIPYLALFAVMGASRGLLARMTLVQALWLAFLGWGIGSGLAALIALLTSSTELAFFLPWQLPLITGILMGMMCSLAALMSIRRIYTLELATLFKR